MPNPAQAAEELLRRRDARKSLLPFIQYTKAGYIVGDHHRQICAALEAVERGELDRLMIFAPPRHGKSEIVSRRGPAWFLGRNPERQIITASYGQDLANDFGRDVRNLIATSEYAKIFPDVKLSADSAAKNKFNTDAGGSFVAAGVGAAITGRGADILLIDDPLKDRAEADSQTIRDSVWNWFTSTAYTRLMPGGAVIVTLTRWHEDDLAGRLMEEMASGGDQWRIMDLKAIDDNGNALWPARYPLESLERIQAAVGERDWSALYQQSPVPLEGAIFKADGVRYVDIIPAGCRSVRAWDLAATAQAGSRNPDWSVGVKLLQTPDSGFIVSDVVRLRGGPEEVERAIKATAERDGKSTQISIPQDPGQAGKSQVLYLAKHLIGYKVYSSPETGDKATRAAPFASQFNIGNVSLLRASWNRAYLEEIGGFPNAAKDDQVDASSRAFAQLIPTTRKPTRSIPLNIMAR